MAKTTKLDDDEVKDETYDPYRSTWWEQVNQELNNEFENVSKELVSTSKDCDTLSVRRVQVKVVARRDLHPRLVVRI